MTATLADRAAQLAQITGGNVEWYAHRKNMTRAEGLAGVRWCGETMRYVPGGSGGDVLTSKAGNKFVTAHGSGRAYAK